jgi:eukaryotic-like serine/threonine-protein kinase
MSSRVGGTVQVGAQELPELGRGTNTVVYRLRLSETDFTVKVFDGITDRSEDVETALRAFRREATMLAGINHPGVPRVYDVGRVWGRPYLVTKKGGRNQVHHYLSGL